MKLYIVVPYFTPYIRGNEYGLAEAITKLGHDVTIIASRGKAPRGVGEDSSIGFDFNVEYLPTPLNIADNPIVTGMNLKGYDVVLLQEDYPLICHKAYKEAKKLGIKTVLSSERTYYPHGLKRAVLMYLDKTTNKRLRDGVDVFTTHCSEAKRFMRELGVERDVKIIHVGVDTTLFQPMKPKGEHLPNGGGAFKILTVARLHQYKGVEYLIRAMYLLQKEMPEAKLYVLGRGKEEENLRKLVKTLGLERKVVFIQKPIPNHEMPILYSECDVYAQPSLIEPYGIAVVEAMACGKPVIGTKVGGMRDTIKDGETGFLVEPGNAGEIADRMNLLKDLNKRAKMGKKARERVLERFDWTVIGEKYIEVVEGLW